MAAKSRSSLPAPVSRIIGVFAARGNGIADNFDTRAPADIVIEQGDVKAVLAKRVESLDAVLFPGQLVARQGVPSVNLAEDLAR